MPDQVRAELTRRLCCVCAWLD
uniref:Uncharacterized protein n=1 Tax=Anguilla anguilla TaxID=7936 RepID=A0A0E9QS92_ANGAN